MLRDTIAAPSRVASKGDTCLYIVPMITRSSLDSTGALMAPGMWSSANSSGVRTSMTSSKFAIWSSGARREFKAVADRASQRDVTRHYRMSGFDARLLAVREQMSHVMM